MWLVFWSQSSSQWIRSRKIKRDRRKWPIIQSIQMEDIDTWIDVNNFCFFFFNRVKETKPTKKTHFQRSSTFRPIEEKMQFLAPTLPCNYLFNSFFIFASTMLTWNENRTAVFSKINKQYGESLFALYKAICISVWKLQCNCGIIYNFYFVHRLRLHHHVQPNKKNWKKMLKKNENELRKKKETCKYAACTG